MENTYFVITEEGLRYGPATLQNLNEWLAEGRISPTTTIEVPSLNQTFPAQNVPGILTVQSQPVPAPMPAPVQATVPVPVPVPVPQSVGTFGVQGAPTPVPAPVLNPAPVQLEVVAQAQPTQAPYVPPTPQMESYPGTGTFGPSPAPVEAPGFEQAPVPAYMQAPQPAHALDPTAQLQVVSYPRENQGEMPQEFEKKFHWGAFGFGWLWSVNHKLYWPLASLALSVIPFGWVGSIAIQIYLGKIGYATAWKSGKFQSWDQCLAVQNKYTFWTKISYLIVAVLATAVIGFLMLSGPTVQKSNGKKTGNSSTTSKGKVRLTPNPSTHKPKK